MFLLWKMMFFLVAALQVMNDAVSADVGTKYEWNVDYCNCENNRNNDLFQEGISEQAEECQESLHQLNQSHSQAAAEWQREKLDLYLKLQNKERELTKLQQTLHDQIIKYEALQEERQISKDDRISHESNTAICKVIHDAKCVGVRCYDVKLAQDRKAHNSLTAIAMYENLITKLTSCLKIPNIHIQQLINEKADLQRKLKEIELHNAAMTGNIQMARNLISEGVNISATNEDRNSGLIFASWNNHTAIVKLFIEAGAYLDAQNINNSTALILAAYHNHIEICKLLLEAGANANIKNRHGEAPLTYAVWRENLELVKMLLEKGADVNIATNDGNTPLHTAARYGNIDITKILVKYGANINVKNNEGKSPLDRASFYHSAQIVRYLMSIAATD